MREDIEIRKAALQRQLDRYFATRKPSDWPSDFTIQQLNRDILVDQLWRRVEERLAHR